ncbi:hypothetical protein ACLMJK_001213 [Lecanora helva]
MSTTVTPTYTSFTLPHDVTELKRVYQKYRDLRLYGLRNDPEISALFTFDQEASWTDTTWLEYLTLPRRYQIVCAASQEPTTGDDSHAMLTGDWVGTITMCGPLSREECTFPASDLSDSEPQEDFTRWWSTGFYLRPEHRGRQAAVEINRGAIELVRSQTVPTDWLSSRDARIWASRTLGNDKVKRMHDGAGYVEAGFLSKAELKQMNAFDGQEETFMATAEGGAEGGRGTNNGSLHERRYPIVETWIRC